jgi:hypothetical protein
MGLLYRFPACERKHLLHYRRDWEESVILRSQTEESHRQSVLCEILRLRSASAQNDTVHFSYDEMLQHCGFVLSV